MSEDREPTVGSMYTRNMPEDYDSDLLALFVLDEIPNEDLNTLIRENSDGDHSCSIWLADTYDTLPDYAGLSVNGTEEPIDPNWRSPFIGKTVRDAVDFMRNAPKPPKPLNKRFCAVVTKDLFRQRRVLICKSLHFDSEQDRLEDEEEGEEFHYDSDSEEDRSHEDDDEWQPHRTLEELGGDLEAYVAQPSSDPRIVEAVTSRITTKQILQELGNDYENVQVAPTPRNQVDLFQLGFHRYRWAARYRAWRQAGFLI